MLIFLVFGKLQANGADVEFLVIVVGNGLIIKGLLVEFIEHVEGLVRRRVLIFLVEFLMGDDFASVHDSVFGFEYFTHLMIAYFGKRVSITVCYRYVVRLLGYL